MEKQITLEEEKQQNIEKLKEQMNELSKNQFEELITTTKQIIVKGTPKWVRVHEFQYEYNGTIQKFTIKKLSYGERQELIESYTKMVFERDGQHATTSFLNLRINTILYGLIEAPFPINREEIYNLDKDLGDLLFEKCNLINEFKEKKD